MALPVPVSPLVLPNFTQDRGPISIDPVTKSTKSEASGYVQSDVCGTDAWYVLQQSMTINQNSPDCQNVTAGQVSISLRLPVGATNADIDLLVNNVVADLKIKRGALAA